MAIANVSLDNTFDEWRTKTNELIVQGDQILSYIDSDSIKTNTAFIQANTARNQANTARDQANIAFTQANAAFTASNVVFGQANTARDQANAAFTASNVVYGQANTARNQANAAFTASNVVFGQANTARDQANTARDQANTARDQANVAFSQANTARNQANAAFTASNVVYGQANTARDQANVAFSQANAAFLRANVITNSQIQNGAVSGGKIALGSDAQGDLMYYDGVLWTRLPAGTSGQVLKTRGEGANPFWSSASVVPDIVIQDQKSSTVDGGTFTSGADRTRVLNTLVRNVDSMASLASNQFTLPAGTFYIEWSAPAYAVNGHLSQLYDITAGLTVSRSRSVFATNGAGITTFSEGWALVTLASSGTYEIRHRCQTSRSTDGFGAATSLGTETYTEVRIWKVA